MRLAQTAAERPLMASATHKRCFVETWWCMHGSELYCRIETPKGSFVAQRTPIDHWVPSPADCCYFPDTLDTAGRPLEALVCAHEPGPPGGRVSVKPVALIRAHTGRGPRDIVVCVADDDPAWVAVDRVQDLPEGLRREFERFVIARRSHQDAHASVSWCSRDDALTAIDDAAARWAETVNGHG
jgi:inorganic pyrophosphatase